MGPTERFAHARDLLIRHRADHDRACAEFRWPEIERFNWAYDWFDQVAADPMREALRIVSPEGTHSSTFAELTDRSLRVARYLTDHGVTKGDSLLLMLSNVTPLWETMLAAIRIGAVIIPATTQLTQDDVDDRIARGNVRHVLTDGEGVKKIRTPERLATRLCTVPTPGFVLYDETLTAKADAPRADTRASDPLLLYFTSGTTGLPKLVLHTHASYTIGHLSTMYWIGIQEGDLHQNISSPGWGKHAWSSFFAPWNAGATVFVHEQPRFDAQRTLDVMRAQRVSTLCAPPTVWRMLVLADMGPRPPALRELVSAGEPLNPEVIEHVQRVWGITVRDGFGQTETTAQIANSPGLVVKPGSMGKPLPGYDVTLLDAAGGEVDEGEVVLRLGSRPAGLMTGYLDDPQRTAAASASGFYHTGDQARRDADGYIHFIGRGDDVFKSSDYRISPFELESVLIEHEWVAESAIVPSPDALRLSVPKAFITLVPGTPATMETARTIFAYCATRLAPYKRIRRIEFAPLPKTISGKIRRVELRSLEAARHGSGERGAHEFHLDEIER
jgi:acetyl-CoA synthetase